MTVETTTCRAVHRSPDRSFLKDLMDEINFLCFRMLYGSATAAAIGDFGDLFMGPCRAQDSAVVEEQLRKTLVVDNDTRGFIGAAFLEVVAALALKTHRIDPLMAIGRIVIQETFAYKQTTKNLLLAKWSASRHKERGTLTVIRRLQATIDLLFSTVLAPTVGVVVSGDPELAWRWRKDGSKPLGLLEDCRLIGQPGEEGFLRLQRACNVAFLDVAKRWGWLRLDVQDRSIDENVEMAVGRIMAELQRRGVL